VERRAAMDSSKARTASSKDRTGRLVRMDSSRDALGNRVSRECSAVRASKVKAVRASKAKAVRASNAKASRGKDKVCSADRMGRADKVANRDKVGSRARAIRLRRAGGRALRLGSVEARRMARSTTVM